MSEQQEPLNKNVSETSFCYLSTEDLVASYLDAPTVGLNKTILTVSSAGCSFFDDNYELPFQDIFGA
jgi:hypothetical protein